MSGPQLPSLPPRPRPVGFQPRTTLFIVYFAGFFFLYVSMMILPEMLEVLGSMEPGPEQQIAAEEAARHATTRTRLLSAFLLAALSTGIGAYYEVLPGTRERG